MSDVVMASCRIYVFVLIVRDKIVGDRWEYCCHIQRSNSLNDQWFGLPFDLFFFEYAALNQGSKNPLVSFHC